MRSRKAITSAVALVPIFFFTMAPTIWANSAGTVVFSNATTDTSSARGRLEYNYQGQRVKKYTDYWYQWNHEPHQLSWPDGAGHVSVWLNVDRPYQDVDPCVVDLAATVKGTNKFEVSGAYTWSEGGHSWSWNGTKITDPRCGNHI